MTYKAILICLAVLTAGCATAPSTPAVKTVEVAVPVPCNIPEIAKPIMHFDQYASVEMSLYEKVQLLLAQNYNLKGYTRELEAAASACRQTPDSK